MKTKKILLWALLAIFTSSSCKGEELYRNELTDAVKQVIPYKSGQTVSFINNEGQPLDLFVTKDELGWNKYREGGGAKVDYISYQRKTIELETKSKDFKIYVQLFANSHYSNETNTNGELRIETYVQWKHYLQSKIGFYADYDAEGKMLSKSNKIIHESIEINNKIFHDVIELSGTYDGFDGGGGQFASSTQLFYNKTYGILQINIGKENFITLNPAMLEDGTGVKSSAPSDQIEMTNSILNHSVVKACQSAGKPVYIAGDLNPKDKDSYPSSVTPLDLFASSGFEVLNYTDRIANHGYYIRHHATSEEGGLLDLILGHNQNPNHEIFWRGVPECLWASDLPNGYTGGEYKDWRFVISDHLPYLIKVKLK